MRQVRSWGIAIGWFGAIALGALHVVGAWPEAPTRLLLSPNLSGGTREFRLLWPSRPDVLHTLMRLPQLGGEAEAAWVIPGSREPIAWTGSADNPHGFYRLRTVRPVPVVVDDFQRVGKEPWNLPPLGETWQMLGWGGVQSSQDGLFTNGVFTTRRSANAAVTYLLQQLPDSPCLMEARFR